MDNLLKNLEKHDDDTNRRAIKALVSKMNKGKRMDLLGRICEVIHENKYS